MEAIRSFFNNYIVWLSMPKITFTDIVEILIIAVAMYHIILWVKDTRAWVLVKGIVFLGLMSLVALILDMSVILWVFKNCIGVGITALVIIFQPELRNALEQLGRKGFVSRLQFDDKVAEDERFSLKSINSIVRATTNMASVKTGALIVLEREIQLREYERTGIPIDSLISSQLLINIFEKNTPLHDGAIILRKNRVVTATCYLPMSDNLELSKELGTRHRAALGISEVSDSMTIVVSEETGSVSIAENGVLTRNVKEEELLARLQAFSNISGKGKSKWWKKGRGKKNESQTDENLS